MGQATKIEWTDATWNPIRGCRRVSAGCEHCYAETTAARFAGPGKPYEGLVMLDGDGRPRPRWNGKVLKVPAHLSDPLRWTRPRLVFVNSMSDLFFEPLDFEYIAAVFGVMAASPRHTFQVLTKRPDRAREFFAWLEARARHDARRDGMPDHGEARQMILRRCAEDAGVTHRNLLKAEFAPWPLPHVWLGVSVEDQATANLRVPALLRLPNAVPWVSYEPALGPVNFRHLDPTTGDDRRDLIDANVLTDAIAGPRPLAWIVVGGESGHGARPFDLAWARRVIAQADAGVTRVFVKQLGARPVDTDADGNTALRQAGYVPRPVPVELQHTKGGDWDEWEDDLRVRDYPAGVDWRAA